MAELRAMLRRVLGRSFGNTLPGDRLDDLTQDAALRVHEKLDTFSGRSKFTTWAASIAVNLALSELRRRKYQAVSLEEAVTAGEQSVDPAAGREIHERERDALLLEAIESALTEKQREALMAELGGLPLMEVARRLGKSRGAVYKMLHDARGKLREHFEARGLRAEDLLSGER